MSLIKIGLISIAVGMIVSYGINYYSSDLKVEMPKPDYTFEVKTGVDWVAFNEVFQKIVREKPYDKVIHFVLDNNPGGYPTVVYALGELSEQNNLIFTAEIRGTVFSAAANLAMETTMFKMNKDASIGIHTGYMVNNQTGVYIPIAFPTVLGKEYEGGFFMEGLHQYIRNSFYLTKDQWNRFLIPQDIIIKGDKFCEQNKDKILKDDPKYCILKGFAYPGSVKPIDN